MEEVNRTRKRNRQPQKWKKNIAKLERYKAKTLPKLPGCHHGKKKVLVCEQIGMQDIRRFHERFYSNFSKSAQDSFILKHTQQTLPKRCQTGKRSTQVAIKYFMSTKNKGNMQICQKAFLKILGISKFRVQNISKNFLKDGKSPKEKRGGDHSSGKFIEIRKSLRNFFSQLQFVESHYTREKSLRRYLPSDCNVRKLWKQYNQGVDHEKKVKYSFFLHVFNYDYNISFKSPATDACSTCISLRCKISVTPSGKNKTELMTQLNVHKMKSRCFYDMLKNIEEPTVMKLSFDCQKNLVLPRVPDQAAYYCRQLYLYNFTICVGNSQSAQNIDSVFMYSWLEHERLKGSNEISSILFHHLQKSDLTNVREIKLFCDGCPGQNKNMTVTGMLCKWLSNTKTGVDKITIVFPVVGHSFLPADRVFGRIEKRIKKIDTLIDPQEYLTIFSEFGTVCKVTEEVVVADWKTEVSSVLKSAGQLHFKFAPSKRVIITKDRKGISVQGEEHYRSNLGVPKSILKKGKTLAMITPITIHCKHKT